MICHTCVYSGPAPGYPPINPVQVCSHHTTVATISANLPKERWHGQAVELALMLCKGRGFKPRGKE